MGRVDIISSRDAIRTSAEGPAPAVLFERVLGERIDADCQRWLVEAFREFDRHDGALPLERCLKLPTATQRRLAERDFWIRTAAALIDEPKPVLRATRIARLLSTFMARCAWRDLPDPPESATDLERALFHAARAIGTNPVPKWRQIMRVLEVVIESPSNDNAQSLLLRA